MNKFLRDDRIEETGNNIALPLRFIVSFFILNFVLIDIEKMESHPKKTTAKRIVICAFEFLVMQALNIYVCSVSFRFWIRS